MKKLIILVNLSFLLGFGPVFAKTAHVTGSIQTSIPVGPKIRVLLVKETPAALLEVRGAYRVVRKDLGEILSYGSAGKRFIVHALENGIRWGEEYPDINQFSVIPLNSEKSIFVNGMQYQGNVTVYHIPNNKIAVVNEVALEDFVKSVLAIKYDGAFSKEEQEVFAILERTQAFSKIQTKRPWDVSADEARYYGYGVTKQQNSIEDSVDATRFMVLEFSDGKASDMACKNIHELACKGMDTQKILKTAFPKAKMSVTIDPEEVTIR